MDKFFQGNNLIKNIYIGHSYLGLNIGDLGSKETFLSMLNSGQKELRNTCTKIEYSRIVRLILYPEENAIDIQHNQDGKSKKEKTFLQWKDQADYKEVLTFIVSKCKSLKGDTERIGSKLAIVRPSAYSIVTLIMSLILIITAATYAGNETLAVGNHRFAIQDLTISIARTLGLLGTIIITIVVMAGFAVYITKAYNNSKVKRIIYK